ncbi:MAG: hypothetical protein LH473_04595 [Chitinophagales bacterium]|nr:hypothetical protein [Chitinophagales bacterium]
MKTVKNLIAMIAVTAFISSNVFAQTPAAPPKAAPAKDASKTEAQHTNTTGGKEMSKKDEWLKQYNEMKPKMDRYLADAKTNGDINPEFTNEVKKLDMAMTDYKSKIDKWDNATPEQKAKYEDMMKQQYSRIQQQVNVVKDMHAKLSTNTLDKKAAPAQQK